MAPQSSNDRPLLVLLSGLGMDWRLVAPQARAFGDDVHVPVWLSPLPRESLHAYAERWAPQLAAGLPPSRPIVLAGVSFGGMVALELAPLLDPASVVLISSATSPSTVPWYLDLLERAMWLTPTRLVAPALPLAARLMSAFERLDVEERALLTDAFTHCDLELARWSAWACTRWRGTDLSLLAETHVAAIHGDRDWVLRADLPLRLHVVRDGRHLVNLSHADEVNAFLARQLVRAALLSP